MLLSHEIIPFKATCLEIIILSELNQTNIIWYHLHVESAKKKKKDINELIYKTKQTYRRSRQTMVPKGEVGKGYGLQ